MHGLSEILHPWHEFYLLLGTAAATLVGLMFVAASIGTRLFDQHHTAPVRAFISPTVVHFSSVLFLCVAAIAPTQTRFSFALCSPSEASRVASMQAELDTSFSSSTASMSM